MRLLPASLYALGWVSLVTAQSSGSVIVDDSSIFSESNLAGIQYGGLTIWDHRSADTNLYKGTQSLSRHYGAQIWFSFRGTGIAYYATVAPGGGLLSISVDGADSTEVALLNPGSEPAFQQMIWSVGGLEHGDHTVVIGKKSENDYLVGLDYFSVTSSAGNDIRPTIYGPGASNVTDGAVIVDSYRDGIVYSDSDWRPYRATVNSSAQAMFFTHNETCSVKPGSTATFTFDGTALWYFSDDNEYNARVSIRVDDGEAEFVQTATIGSRWVSQKLFWSVTGLDRGPHKVTITHAGTVDEWACIDFLMYLPSSASPSPSKKSVPVGAMVGGVVAGAVVLAVIIALAVVYTRRKSSQTGPETAVSPAEDKAKQVDAGYNVTNLEYAPRPTSIQGLNTNGDGTGSISPTTQSDPTYRGHPEIQQ
ncbi:transmembrane protein [Ceratobasidium sp. AG-Ba]|nr:transmembrane protein [Ceratobasidium sp. AG-Ba]